MRHVLALLLLLPAVPVLAAPAQTGSWARSCGGQTTTGLNPGEIACYTPVSGADDESATPILSVGNCENVDVFLHDDYDGDATVCTVTWAVEGCPPGASALATDALKNAACNTLEGVADVGATDSVRGNLAAEFIRFHGQNAGANISSCRIVVKCAQRAN